MKKRAANESCRNANFASGRLGGTGGTEYIMGLHPNGFTTFGLFQKTVFISPRFLDIKITVSNWKIQVKIFEIRRTKSNVGSDLAFGLETFCLNGTNQT